MRISCSSDVSSAQRGSDGPESADEKGSGTDSQFGEFSEQLKGCVMRIMARESGILDGISRCIKCDAPMVKIASQYRCMKEAEPEELVAAGLIPSKDMQGNIAFDLSAKDQQSIQTTQALSKSVEIDNAYLEKMGLNLEKIRQFQLKLGLVP